MQLFEVVYDEQQNNNFIYDVESLEKQQLQYDANVGTF